MADSANHKTQNVGEKNKYTNMINRTTSESMRLNDSDKILSHPTTLSATSTTTPRKKTSFQITSVTVGGHTSTDGGDDSADDLDESHAEDISELNDISRATDIENETPSYSEDTFSKDDVFFNSSTSLGTAPVIPTSSQYGLAIVSTPEGCNNINNANVTGGSNAVAGDLHVNVNDNVINLGIVGNKHLEGDMRDIHAHAGRNERFKVVKIESTEPFKRGRWMCMDYLDHTMQQQQQQQHQLQSQGSAPNTIAANDVNLSQFTGTDSGISLVEHQNTHSVQGLDELAHVDHSHSSSLASNTTLHDQQNPILHSIITVAGQNSVSPGQTMQYNAHGGNTMQPAMNAPQQQQQQQQQQQPPQQQQQPQPMQQQAQSMTAVSSQHPQIGTNQHQSLQPQQMQQVLSTTNIHNQQPQQMQQPMQQMQHQGIPMQLHHQNQPAPNIIQQQQYQQQPQMQPIHHQQGNLQSVQQAQAQAMMQQQQQQAMPQHIPQQSVQHQQHSIPIQVQQQMNQGQMPVQVPQAVMQNQGNIQQLSQQSAQMQVHPQMQPGAPQHLQHVPVQQMSMAAPQVMQTQSAQQQQQQYHHPTSQPMMQPGIQTQPNLMSVQQVQYYTNPQMQTTNMVHALSNQLLQSQAQGNPNVALQQNYPVNSMSQQQTQQMSMGHTMPASIPHLSQQVSSSNVPVMMSQPAPLPVINNMPIPATQNSVISPQPASQGISMPLVQQYFSQQLSSSLAPTLQQSSRSIQTYPSSAVNPVPSVMENVVQVYPVETSTEQTVNQQVEILGDGAGGNEAEQQVEDAENAPGASAVAIDNKIEQAMDLVKSHLMFAVREEVEVLKEKIAELMDRINQLEMENTVLKASATQETLAQLSTLPPAGGNAP